MLKKLILLHLVLILLAAIVVLFSGRLSYSLAQKFVNSQNKWTISAQAGDLDLIGGVLTMTHVWLRSPDGQMPEIVMKAEYAGALPDRSAFLRGRWVIDKLVLRGMRLKHVSTAVSAPTQLTGKKLGDSIPAAADTDGQDDGLLVRLLVIENGFVEFIHQKNALRKTNITLEDVNITANDVYIGKDFDAFLNSILKPDIDRKW